MGLYRPIVASWTKKTLQDHFFTKAKKEGYASRAAYKLKEIQTKHKLIKPGGDMGQGQGQMGPVVT